MADDKARKTKIDLKARLGKTTTQVGLAPPPGALPVPPGATPPPPSSEPGSNPMPAPPSSVPASVRPPIGIAPPPGLSPGIPMPPFAQAQRPAPAPAPKPTAAQQTIKVEVGEEMEVERKKWRSRVFLGAAAGAVIGLVIGFVAGDSSSTGGRKKAAARGAGLLEKDVKGTVDKLKDLDQKVAEAAEKIKNKAYPDDLSTALAGLKIPFESGNLDGKDVGSLPRNLLKNVLNFTSGVENLDKSRETLANMASSPRIKDPITKMWKEETTPMVNFSVVFRKEGDKNVVAELVPNIAPFAWKGDYPGSYKVNRSEGGRPAAEKSANRWVKGDLPGNDLTVIPIDPKTTPNPEAVAMLGQLYKRLTDMHSDLAGNKDNPTNETPGLIKLAEDLSNELHKQSLNQ